MSIELDASIRPDGSQTNDGKVNLTLISSRVINTPDQVRELLEAEGIIFHPKERVIEVPRIDEAGEGVILNKLGVSNPSDRDLVRDSIGDISNFIGGEVMTDQFPTHEARQAWRNEHYNMPYGQIFQEVYDRRNILGSNCQAVIIFTLQTMASVLDPSSPLTLSLNSTTERLINLTTGKENPTPYNHRSIQAKISIARQFVDESAATLRMIGQGLPLEAIRVT